MKKQKQRKPLDEKGDSYESSCHQRPACLRASSQQSNADTMNPTGPPRTSRSEKPGYQRAQELLFRADRADLADKRSLFLGFCFILICVICVICESKEKVRFVFRKKFMTERAFSLHNPNIYITFAVK